MSLDPIFAALAGRRCFIAWYPVPKNDGTGKVDKIPYDPQTRQNIDAQNPDSWMSAEDARHYAAHGVQVGIVLSEELGVFCVDLDAALQPDNTWSPFALAVLDRFPTALVEVSHSGRGLHIFGRYDPAAVPNHRTRRDGVPMEVYTRKRFIALTGTHMAGEMTDDRTHAVRALIAEYLPEPVGQRDADWTTGPWSGWRGGGTDEQIIAAQMNRAGAHALFGDGATFKDLWTCDADALARAFPDRTGKHPWNQSAADQALANHLAWATGWDCERTLRLMRLSGLRRDKWEREDYMRRTIIAAVAGKIPQEPATVAAGPTIPAQAGSGPQIAPDECKPSQPNAPQPGDVYIPPPPVSNERRPLPPPGTYLTAAEQLGLFEGCIYIEDIHGILMPDGNVLAQKQFDVHFAGFDLQMRADGTKPTTNAWDAFVDSQLNRNPRATGLVFDPTRASRETLVRDGLTYINSWVPIAIPMMPGDPAPFLNHLRALYPYGEDADILLAYMAALMQYKGKKFQWSPLLQGVEGNGKTFFSLCMEHCMGQRYTHHAKAAQLDNRFNSAFYGKLLVTVEDVYISEARTSMWETLKPMITNTRMEIEGKGLDKVTRDVCFNFLMNSNHKNAIRKTRNDRRIASFFGAQQHEADLARCGLTEDYFRQLYRWADAGGYAIIANFLNTYAIPDKWNPATHCVRAPVTSSTEAALTAGRGTIEQEVVEAIEEGRPGFRGGWISSTQFDFLLGELGKAKMLARNQRRELLEGMGYALHPGLPDGRVVAALTDGTRPRLYCLPGVAQGITDPHEIARLFTAAQTVPR